MKLHDSIQRLGEDTDAEMRFLTAVARHFGVTFIHYLVQEGIEWQSSRDEVQDTLYVCWLPKDSRPFSAHLHNYVDPTIIGFLHEIRNGDTLAVPAKHAEAVKSSMVEVTHYVTKNPRTQPVSINYTVPVRVSLMNDDSIMLQIATK